MEEAEASFYKDFPTEARAHLPKRQGWQRRATPLPAREMKKLLPLFERPGCASQEEADAHCRELFQEYERTIALLTDEEEGSLSWYSGMGFESVNPYLRTGVVEEWPGYTTEARRARLDQEAALLTSAIEKAPERTPRMLYRYQEFLTPLKAREFVEAYFPVGERMVDRGFMSTSEEPGVMAALLAKRKERATARVPVVFQLISKEGITLQQREREMGGNLQSFEKERLLPRELSFRVVGHRRVPFTLDKERSAMRGTFSGKHLASALPALKEQAVVVYLMEEDLLPSSGQEVAVTHRFREKLQEELSS